MANEKVYTITKDNFEDFIKGETPCLIDFWASWCGPCRMLGPVIDEIAELYDGKLKVGKVNVDDSPSLAADFKVMTIPTVVIMKNGEVVDKNIGAIPLEAMEDFIDNNL